MAALQFMLLVNGAVLTETIFALPGIGRELVDSVFARDFPVVQTILFFSSTGFVLVNLGVDILYAYIDPRIRYN
jgi:ABC-type dipeptide/oligopeptide/nickel transport system permease component